MYIVHSTLNNIHVETHIKYGVLVPLKFYNILQLKHLITYFPFKISFLPYSLDSFYIEMVCTCVHVKEEPQILWYLIWDSDLVKGIHTKGKWLPVFSCMHLQVGVCPCIGVLTLLVVKGELISSEHRQWSSQSWTKWTARMPHLHADSYIEMSWSQTKAYFSCLSIGFSVILKALG